MNERKAKESKKQQKQEKIRMFKNKQARLAKKIAEILNSRKFSVRYEQRVPSAWFNEENGKTEVRHVSQILFPTKDICKGTARVIAVMRFSCKICKIEEIGKIIKRGFSIKPVEGGVEIRIPYKPETILKVKAETKENLK